MDAHLFLPGRGSMGCLPVTAGPTGFLDGSILQEFEEVIERFFSFFEKNHVLLCF
jgi:hypothetical protein